jgi:predicted transcriptional regulator
MSAKIIHTDLRTINIGSVIEHQFRNNSMTFTEFADRLNCDRSTIYAIFKRDDIDMERLIKISEILKFDFIHACYLGNKYNDSNMSIVDEITKCIEKSHRQVSNKNEKYIHNVNIGSLIQQQLKINSMSITEFASKLDCDRTTVYSIFKCKTINIKRLILISEILDFDFIHTFYFKDKSSDLYANILLIRKFLNDVEKNNKIV